jgi:hypothetical protein
MMEDASDVPQPPADVPKQMIVTSCEEENDSSSDSSAGSMESSDGDKNEGAPHEPDDLFDDQADDEDEAYVYKHLRSGIEESVTVANKSALETNDPRALIQRQQLKVLKPRNSDAVLSCPCCFNIVCMDCQLHEYYKNQYRAMFVMGISVRWDLTLRYDETERTLVQVCASETHDSAETRRCMSSVPILSSDHNEISNDSKNDNENDVIYYTVCCANCQTTVAALDMTDEVYYFSGCLASL